MTALSRELLMMKILTALAVAAAALLIGGSHASADTTCVTVDGTWLTGPSSVWPVSACVPTP